MSESQHSGQPAGSQQGWDTGASCYGGCWGGQFGCWELFFLLPICDLACVPSCIVLSTTSAHLETVGWVWGVVKSVGVGWQLGPSPAGRAGYGPPAQSKGSPDPCSGGGRGDSALACCSGPAWLSTLLGLVSSVVTSWHSSTLQVDRQGWSGGNPNQGFSCQQRWICKTQVLREGAAVPAKGFSNGRCSGRGCCQPPGLGQQWWGLCWGGGFLVQRRSWWCDCINLV